MTTMQPPVRRPVPVSWHPAGLMLNETFPAYEAVVCGSGTEALALALQGAAPRAQSRAPEALLPAYGCPDLVAACLHAGVRPRLVDTVAGGWGFDVNQLEAAISPDTVALVAVNLLGTGDQAEELRAIATSAGAALIQDSAQQLPAKLPAKWVGDYVVLSFGRGKPLNLLRGGMLLRAGAAPSGVIPQPAESGFREWLLSGRLAALAFNAATRPSVYGTTRRLVGASIGETRFRPLEAIHSGSRRLTAQVLNGLVDYQDAPGYDASIWREACREWERAGIDALVCPGEVAPRNLRLRLALTAPDAATCAALVSALEPFGATRMYGTTLERIPQIPGIVASQGPFPNARHLAECLFTLPTHSLVTAETVDAAQEAVRRVLGQP